MSVNYLLANNLILEIKAIRVSTILAFPWMTGLLRLIGDLMHSPFVGNLSSRMPGGFRRANIALRDSIGTSSIFSMVSVE